MGAPTIAVSETLTLASNTEQHFSQNVYYHSIVVDNSGDAGGGTADSIEVYICTDGGTATVAGAHCEMVPYGATRTFDNLQPLPNPNVASGAAAYSDGVDGTFSQSESVDWTAQSGNAVTGCTYCSLIIGGSDLTQIVTVTFE